MAHEYTSIVDHLKDHAGDALQAVLVYENDQHRDLYRREDIENLHDTALERETIEAMRDDHQRRNSALAEKHEGDHRATARVFDSRVILHLPRDAKTGTVILLDPSVARNLVEFVNDIRADIY